jgi:plastocyanin
MKISKFVLITALLVLSSCLLSGAASAQMNNSVMIKDFAFQPNILVVPVGTTVTWTNQDTVQHEVISDNGTFDSGIMMPNDQFTHTFSQPGNYSYYCKIHSYMFGMIQVTPGSSGLKVMSADPSSDPAPSKSYSQFSMYSQYFSMPSGNAPKTHITYPKNYPMKNLGSTFVYFTFPKYTTSYSQSYGMSNYYQMYSTPNYYQMYSMPYAQYNSNYASYSGSTSLWIQGTSGLTQYVTVPQGASMSLIAISPTGGNGYLYETAPGGKSNMNYYYFNQYSQMNFYADTVGQHVLFIVINDRVSNSIIINVVSSSSSYSTPSYQTPSYQQPTYQQPSYSQPSGGYPSSGGY